MPGTEMDGEAVVCRDSRGRALGAGVFNSRSQIVWRRFAWEARELDEAFLRHALARAVRKRPAVPARRLVWSESDNLPGLVVDQYGDVLSIQALTLAMDRRLSIIADILGELLAPREMVFRNNAPIRDREGLGQSVVTKSGEPLEAFWLNVNGIDYLVDAEKGQKTGLYVDQLGEHRRVAGFANGARVLDAFCNQGGFALHCAREGAERVLGVDSSQTAIEQARRSAERNGAAVEFSEANVFDFFRRPDQNEWDLIVLDPPPFAKSLAERDRAARGYKEIHLRAFKSLVAGGILATYSCSHHIDQAFFLGVIGEAAADARREVTVLEFCHQPPDHPVLPWMPESEYLRGFVLRVE